MYERHVNFEFLFTDFFGPFLQRKEKNSSFTEREIYLCKCCLVTLDHFALELFSGPLYAHNQTDLHVRFQAVFQHVTCLEYQI